MDDCEKVFSNYRQLPFFRNSEMMGGKRSTRLPVLGFHVDFEATNLEARNAFEDTTQSTACEELCQPGAKAGC